MTKEMVISVESPVADLGNIGGSIWPSVAPLVLRHIQASNTTLVFVNNRAQAEKIAARVNTLAEEEIALPYHGSLARERRFALEERLKAGSLRALVTTSSLELGIDIGSVDLVIQLQSPKRVASALQRIGRAGHTLGVPSRGILVPTFRDDAVEIAAIVAAMRAGDVEPTHVVQNALDVLAQVVVAAVSVDDWRSEDLFRLVRRSYPYHQLTRSAFDEVLAMLSGKYPSDIAAELEPRITWDRVNDSAHRLASSAHDRRDLGRDDPGSRPLHRQSSRSHAGSASWTKNSFTSRGWAMSFSSARRRGESRRSSTIAWSSRQRRVRRRGCRSGTANTWRGR